MSYVPEQLEGDSDFYTAVDQLRRWSLGNLLVQINKARSDRDLIARSLRLLERSPRPSSHRAALQTLYWAVAGLASPAPSALVSLFRLAAIASKTREASTRARALGLYEAAACRVCVAAWLLFFRLKAGFSGPLVFLQGFRRWRAQGCEMTTFHWHPSPRMKVQQFWSCPTVTRGGALAVLD